ARLARQRSARADVRENLSVVALHLSARAAADRRRELEHGRVGRAASAGRGGRARAGIGADLARAAPASAWRVTLLDPCLDAVAAPAGGAVGIAAVAVHGVAVVTFLAGVHRVVAAQARQRRRRGVRGTERHAWLAGPVRSARQREAVLVHSLRLALARDAHQGDEGFPGLVLLLSSHLDDEVARDGPARGIPAERSGRGELLESVDALDVGERLLQGGGRAGG